MREANNIQNTVNKRIAKDNYDANYQKFNNVKNASSKKKWETAKKHSNMNDNSSPENIILKCSHI